MLKKDIVIGNSYLTIIGGNLCPVVVMSIREPNSWNKRTTYIVRRIGESRDLPKSRTAAALRPMPAKKIPWEDSAEPKIVLPSSNYDPAKDFDAMHSAWSARRAAGYDEPEPKMTFEQITKRMLEIIDQTPVYSATFLDDPEYKKLSEQRDRLLAPGIKVPTNSDGTINMPGATDVLQKTLEDFAAKFDTENTRYEAEIAAFIESGAEMPTMDRQALGHAMMQWHSGMWDPVYMVGSVYSGNRIYPDANIAREALENLEIELTQSHTMLAGEVVNVSRNGAMISLREFAGYTDVDLQERINTLTKLVIAFQAQIQQDYPVHAEMSSMSLPRISMTGGALPEKVIFGAHFARYCPNGFFRFGNDKRIGNVSLNCHNLWSTIYKAATEMNDASATKAGQAKAENLYSWISGILGQLGIEWI